MESTNERDMPSDMRPIMQYREALMKGGDRQPLPIWGVDGPIEETVCIVTKSGLSTAPNGALIFEGVPHAKLAFLFLRFAQSPSRYRLALILPLELPPARLAYSLQSLLGLPSISEEHQGGGMKLLRQMLTDAAGYFDNVALISSSHPALCDAHRNRCGFVGTIDIK